MIHGERTKQTTELAAEMGVLVSPGMDPLTGKAKRAVNKVLRDLDREERNSLVMIGATGRFDWHMVDGTGRIWHFTADGGVSWNMVNDQHEKNIFDRAYKLGWDDSHS